MSWIEGETPDQRHARVDKILEKNTTPLKKCITCLQPIDPEIHNLVDSRHGAYHGYPLTCVDGR